MRNAGKILTKDQIINHVWNYDADVLPNTVSMFHSVRIKWVLIPENIALDMIWYNK